MEKIYSLHICVHEMYKFGKNRTNFNYFGTFERTSDTRMQNTHVLDSLWFRKLVIMQLRIVSDIACRNGSNTCIL